MEWAPLPLVPLTFAIFASFFVSAAAGMGGSLVLVPVLALSMGTKEGVAMAALLLATNNVFKVVAYRSTLPLKAALGVVALTALGAALGARGLVSAPEVFVSAAVIVSLVAAFIVERWQFDGLQRVGAPVLAFLSGAASGFSGTSGPLKGAALRCLRFDRMHLVGAAALVSLTGDVVKTLIFARADLVDAYSLKLTLIAVPLMLVGTTAGKACNDWIGERGYRWLFWTVMMGYAARLVAA